MQAGSDETFPSDEMAMFARLETIFMPYASQQRRAFFERNGQFVHYTSAEAALSIIKHKRLWMRNTNCMADFSEVQHGFKMLDTFFKDGTKRAAFERAFDSCFPYVVGEAVNHFNNWWESYRLNTYIASISEHMEDEDQDGRLSMWRAFGGNGARVALIFKVPKYVPGQSQLGILFSPVAYLREDEVHKQLTEVANSIVREKPFLLSVGRELVVNTLFHALIAATVCLKHKGFHEEREWRVIYNPSRGRSRYIEDETVVVGGVPQTIHKLPLDKTVFEGIAPLDFANMFDRAIIGPTQYPTAIYEALTNALMMAGIQNAGARVTVSGIPIRA